jgi:hypothetical protein
LIFTEVFFKDLSSRYKGRVGYLHGLAHNYENCQEEVKKLNGIFNRLPEAMRKNQRFLNSITSDRDEIFRGAFGEMITAYILGLYSHEIQFEPKINTDDSSQKIQTPDFRASFSGNEFIVESFFVGQGEQKKQYDKLYNQVSAELKGIKSNKFISMMGLPIPDRNGGFHGLRNAVQSFLDSLENTEKDLPHIIVSKNDARIILKVSFSDEIREIGLSAVAGGFRGDSVSEVLERAILKKIDKYKFPFIASCTSFVWDHAGFETLMRALIGRPAIQVVVNAKSLEPIDTNTYDGVWGVLNRRLNKHHFLLGVLYTIVTPKSDGLVFHIGYASNPHLEPKNELFHNIPDIMKFAHDGGDLASYKPLRIEI